METIKFRIITVGNNMCRIEANDCRAIYGKLADGACICSLDVMLAEMKHITKEVNAFGNNAIFIID